MFRNLSKMTAAGLVTATLLGGISAASGAERPPKSAGHPPSRHAVRPDAAWSWLSSWVERIQVVFYEGPRIDPLGVSLNVDVSVSGPGSTTNLDLSPPR
jgi:hypothetical protein